jgi:hypothetical protein
MRLGWTLLSIDFTSTGGFGPFGEPFKSRDEFVPAAFALASASTAVGVITGDFDRVNAAPGPLPQGIR